MKRIFIRIALLGLPACTAIACINVGHDTETGCLVDPSLPGCRLPTSTSSGGSGGTGNTTTTSNTSGGGSSAEGGAAGESSSGGQAGAGSE